MKRIAVSLLMLMLCITLSASESQAPSIADESITVQPTVMGSSTKVKVENPFSGIWEFYLKIIVGVLGGTAMLLRLAFELSSAVIFEGEGSQSAVRKVIVRFLTHAGIIVVAFALLAFVF